MKKSSTTIGGKTYNKGDSFTDSAGRTGKVGFDSKTGKALSNPVVGSSGVYAQNNALDRELKGLTGAYRESNNILSAERARIAEERSATLGDIKIQSDIDLASQKVGQERDYGARATSLITSGGGFLGATQSQEGVLQNLKGTFDAEKTALTSKRDAAINAANAAYGDRDFALAKELANNAKSLQNDIYKRQTDSADQQLKIAAGNRAQMQYERGYTDDKIKAYGAMSDADFAKITPEQLADTDKFLYSGATRDLRTAAISSAKNASYKSNLELRNILQTVINKTPYGQKIPLTDGSFAVGLKRAGGVSIKDPISSSLANQLGSSVLAGKSTKDIILQLELPNAPDWYKQIYASQNPEGWERVKNNPNAINGDWFNYRKAESFDPFKQTIDITKTTTNQKKSRFEKIQAGNPDTITPTTTPESDPDEDILNN